jgi:hypothetical protein
MMGLLLCGCASSNRTSIPAEESHYHFTIHHYAGQHKAFLEAEGRLRQINADPITSAQPETGVLLLKPKIAYRTGRFTKHVEYANYDLRIVVTDSAVEMTFDLRTADIDGQNIYPPEKIMPWIRSRFQDVAIAVAQSVEGSLD